VWVNVPNGGCTAQFGNKTVDLTTFTTRDLWLRLDRSFSLLLVGSGFGNAGITFVGGNIFQHPQGFAYQRTQDAPTEDEPDPAPLPSCVEFDSYFSMGTTAPASVQFIPDASTANKPDPHIELVWFSTSAAPAAQNPAPFNDGAFYIRIARLTVPTAATLQTGSVVDAGIVLGGGGSAQTVTVTLPVLP